MEVGFIPEPHQGSCVLLVDAQAGLEDQFVAGVGEDFFGAGIAEGTFLGADGSVGFDGASGLAPVVRAGYGVEAQAIVEGDLGSLIHPLVGAACGAGGGLCSSVVLLYSAAQGVLVVLGCGCLVRVLVGEGYRCGGVHPGHAIGAVVGVGGLFGAQGVGEQVAVGVVGESAAAG